MAVPRQARQALAAQGRRSNKTKTTERHQIRNLEVAFTTSFAIVQYRYQGQTLARNAWTGTGHAGRRQWDGRADVRARAQTTMRRRRSRRVARANYRSARGGEGPGLDLPFGAGRPAAARYRRCASTAATDTGRRGARPMPMAPRRSCSTDRLVDLREDEEKPTRPTAGVQPTYAGFWSVLAREE
jgi:hypothetical protein